MNRWLWLFLVLLLHAQFGNAILAAKLTPPATMPLRVAR
jgi:hypothetical protein